VTNNTDIDFQTIHRLALKGNITADDLPDLVVKGQHLKAVAIYASPDTEGIDSKNRDAIFRREEFPGKIVTPPEGNQYYQVFYGVPDPKGAPGNLAGAGDVAIEILAPVKGDQREFYQSGWNHLTGEGVELGKATFSANDSVIRQWGDALEQSHRFRTAFGEILGITGKFRIQKD